jgi:hypothetical protein
MVKKPQSTTTKPGRKPSATINRPAKSAAYAKGGKVRKYKDGGAVENKMTAAEQRRATTERQNELQRQAEAVTTGGLRGAISTVGNRRQAEQAQLEALQRELGGYARGGKVAKKPATKRKK